MYAFSASSYHFYARPHLVTIALLGWVFGLLCDFEQRRVALSSLVWLMPIFLVWGNAHAGVVGGLGTLGLTVAGWAVCSFSGRGAPQLGVRQLVLLGTLVLCCGLATLVNPYGIDAIRVTFAIINSPIVHQVMSEHTPLLGNAAARWKVLLFGLIYLAALLGVRPRCQRVTWFIPLVWLYLAWTRVRHGPLFAVTATVALADMLPHVRWVDWLAAHGYHLFRIEEIKMVQGLATARWRRWLIPVALVLTACACQGMGLSLPVLGAGWARPSEQRWPYELLPDLQNYQRSHPRGTPVLNDMLFGGFLIYYTPGLKVFIDDRCELYGDEHLLAYTYADPRKIHRWGQEYGFDLALTSTGSPLEQNLRHAGGWIAVRQTKAASLYRRRTP